MRVYLPGTLRALEQWFADGMVGPAPLAATAVTTALRRSLFDVGGAGHPARASADDGDGALDDLEEAAREAAAESSLRILAVDASAPPRRVVLAADVADSAVRAVVGGEPAAVEVQIPVPFSAVRAVLVDEPSAGPVIAAAVQQPAARDAADDTELLWYAPEEIADLLAEG